MGSNYHFNAGWAVTVALPVISPFGVLVEVDRIRACVGVLVHLEVVGRKSKRSQDHVSQFLQFSCKS